MLSLQNAERKLEVSTKTVEEFVDHLSFLSQIADDIPRLEREHELISKLFAIAMRHHSDLSEEEKALFRTLGPSFHQLKVCDAYDVLIHSFVSKLNRLKPGFAACFHGVHLNSFSIACDIKCNKALMKNILDVFKNSIYEKTQ